MVTVSFRHGRDGKPGLSGHSHTARSLPGDRERLVVACGGKERTPDVPVSPLPTHPINGNVQNADFEGVAN